MDQPRLDKPVVEKSLTPPPLVRRIFAGLIAVGWMGMLVAEHTLRTALWALLVCPPAVYAAISPKTLRDGRAKDWEDRHPILLGVGMSTFTGLFAYLLLSMILSDRLSITIAIPVGILYGVSLYVIGRRR